MCGCIARVLSESVGLLYKVLFEVLTSVFVCVRVCECECGCMGVLREYIWGL
jgi:hypothetical protein